MALPVGRGQAKEHSVSAGAEPDPSTVCNPADGAPQAAARLTGWCRLHDMGRKLLMKP